MTTTRTRWAIMVPATVLLLGACSSSSVRVDGETITYGYGPSVYLLPCIAAAVVAAFGYLVWRFRIVSLTGYWIMRTRYTRDETEQWYGSPKVSRVYFWVMIVLIALVMSICTAIAVIKRRQSIVVTPEHFEVHNLTGPFGDTPRHIAVPFRDLEAMELKQVEVGTSTRPKTTDVLVCHKLDGGDLEMRVDHTLFEAARNSIRDAASRKGVDVQFGQVR